MMWIVGNMVSLTKNKLSIKSCYVNFMLWGVEVKTFWLMYFFKTRTIYDVVYMFWWSVPMKHSLMNNWKIINIIGIEGVVLYIKKGCANKGVPWKNLWPMFRRLFTYGGGDITNHVEYHWEWIKYILLSGKVNHSIRNFIVTIMGRAIHWWHKSWRTKSYRPFQASAINL
jgi:hypothetical protein